MSSPAEHPAWCHLPSCTAEYPLTGAHMSGPDGTATVRHRGSSASAWLACPDGEDTAIMLVSAFRGINGAAGFPPQAAYDWALEVTRLALLAGAVPSGDVAPARRRRSRVA